MRRLTKPLILAFLVSLVLTSPIAWGMSAKGFFPEDQIPRFNVPRMETPPKIDGVIDADEWRNAVRIMGMATAHNNTYRGRPHSFWVSWDADHLYVAGHAHVLKGHTLLKSRREKFTTQTVYDDAYEFGISMEGRNQPSGEAARRHAGPGLEAERWGAGHTVTSGWPTPLRG